MARISISIDVSDMDIALTFYENALDCQVTRRDENISKLATENIEIYLLKKEHGSNPLIGYDAVRHYDRHWTPIHLDFAVSDLDKAVSRVKEFGGKIEGKEGGDWGNIVFCSDPFGHGFCVIALNEQ